MRTPRFLVLLILTVSELGRVLRLFSHIFKIYYRIYNAIVSRNDVENLPHFLKVFLFEIATGLHRNQENIKTMWCYKTANLAVEKTSFRLNIKVYCSRKLSEDPA